jgi:PAS domain S-box-containing protein
MHSILANNRGYLAVIIIGTSLVGLIAALLVSNYFSQIELQKVALEQLKSDTEKRAGAVSYFFLERENDLRNLAEKRQLSIFFENKALEMSMEYGLRDSLLSISKVFERFLMDRKLGVDVIYNRIALIESSGAVLVDRSREASPGGREKELKKFLDPERREPAIIVDQEGPRQRITISLAYFFKDRYAGQIVAWISSKSLYNNLVKGTGLASKRFTTIVDQNGQPLYQRAEPPEEAVFSSIPPFTDTAAEEVHRYESVRKDDARVEMIATRTPIKDTPFFLVTVSPASEVFGHTSPGYLLLIVGTLSLALLGGMAVVVRSDFRKKQELEREIADRQQAEEAFSSLVSHAPMGIFIIQDDTYIMINPGFEAITGYRQEELVGQNSKCLVPLGYKEMMGEEAVKRLKGRTSTPFEFQFITKSGETRWGIETVAPTQFGGKRAILGYFMDITERKQLEIQFLQAQKMEAVGRLAGGVAHDFNNILGVIMGYAETIMEMCLGKDDPIYSKAEWIEKSAHKAAALISQLLAFSRKQILKPHVLNLNAVVTNFEKMLRRLIGEDIDLVKFIDQELGLVKADSGQIEQIIMNLAVNARDAMPNGGKLTIETANVYLDQDYAQGHEGVTPGPHVMLAVSDNGTGMDAETLSHIFEPFFTTKGIGKGTGLGLATVYGIVKQSGGHIWVYSEPGQGTTFKVYLPRVEEAVEKPKTKEVASTFLEGNETILVVEDDAGLRELISTVLCKHGFKVLEAAHGGEALLLCEKKKAPIHLMLTDIVMPQISGSTLSEHLRPIHPEMKVLYMSGYTENAIVHHGVIDTEVNFIPKPFRMLDLVRKIREVLDATSAS